jgi:hypothetical protein
MQGLMRVLEYIVADKPPQNELILVLNELGYVMCSFAMAWVLHTVIGSAGIDLKKALYSTGDILECFFSTFFYLMNADICLLFFFVIYFML